MNKQRIISVLGIACFCAALATGLFWVGLDMRHAWINGNRFCVQDIPKKVSCGRMGVTGGLFGDGVTTYSLGYSGINSKTQKECVSWHLVTEAEYSRRMYAKEKQ